MRLSPRTKLAFNTTAFLLGYACAAQIIIETSRATGHSDDNIHPLIFYGEGFYIVFAPLAVLLGRADFDSWTEYGTWWWRAMALVAGHLTARAQVSVSRPLRTAGMCGAAVLGIVAGSFVAPRVSERTASIFLIGFILAMLCGRVRLGSCGEFCLPMDDNNLGISLGLMMMTCITCLGCELVLKEDLIWKKKREQAEGETL